MFELSGQDRQGLLAAVLQVLAGHGCEVLTAAVSGNGRNKGQWLIHLCTLTHSSCVAGSFAKLQDRKGLNYERLA